MNKEKLYCVSGFKPSSYSYDTLSRGFICHCRAIKFHTFGIKELSGKKFTITVKFRKKSTCKHVVRTQAFRFPDEEPNKEIPFNVHIFMEYRHRVRKDNEVIISLSKKHKAAGKRVMGKSSVSLEMFLQSPHLDRIELYTKKHEKVAEIFLLFIGTINMTKEMLMEWAKKSGSKLGGFDVASDAGGSAIRGVDTTDEENEGEDDDHETDENETRVHARSQSGGGTFPSRRKSEVVAHDRTPPNEIVNGKGVGDTPKEDEREDRDTEDSESVGELEKKKKTLGSIMSKAARGLKLKRKKGKRRGSSNRDEEMDELRSQLGINFPVDEQFERILDHQGGRKDRKIPSSGEEEDSAYESSEEEDSDYTSGMESSEEVNDTEKTGEKDDPDEGDEEEDESSGETPVKKKSKKEEETKSEDEGEEEDVEDSGEEEEKTDDRAGGGDGGGDGEEEDSGKEKTEESEEEEPEKEPKRKRQRSKKKKKKKRKRRVITPTKIPDHLIFVDSSFPRGTELASYLTRRGGVFRDNTLYVSKYDNIGSISEDSQTSNPLKEVAARLYEVFKFGEVEVAKRIRFAVVGSDRFYSYILRELLSSSQFSEEFFEKLVFYLIPLVSPGEEKRKTTINEYMASVSPYYERFFTGGDWKNAVRNLGFGGVKDHDQKEQKKMAFMTVEKGIQHYFKNADELLRIPLSQVILTFGEKSEGKSKDPLAITNHLFVPLLSQLMISRRSLDEDGSKKKKGKKISTKKQIKEEQKKVKKSILNVKLDYFQMNNEKKLSLEKKRSQFHKLELSHLREGKHPNFLRKKGFALNIISKPVKAGDKEKVTKIDDIRKLICSVKEKKSVCEVDGFLFQRNVKHIQVDLKHPSEQTLCVALFSNKQKHYRMGEI